jgi:hypothetical protein
MKIKTAQTFAGDVIIAGALSTSIDHAKDAAMKIADKLKVRHIAAVAVAVEILCPLIAWAVVHFFPLPTQLQRHRSSFAAAARAHAVGVLGAKLGLELGGTIAPIAGAIVQGMRMLGSAEDEAEAESNERSPVDAKKK